MNALNDMNGNEPVDTYSEELRPGTQLLHGQFTIERFLNSGGFALTYLARDSLNRIVVIKECFPGTMCTRRGTAVHPRSHSHHKEFRSVVRLFTHEAHRLAKLTHPNIVGVHQVFQENDTAYMVLDFIDGPDLHELIHTGRHHLDPRRVKDILIRLLNAVACIHDNNLLHRDIAPDNILIDRRGNPFLIDFGAARESASRASRVLSALQVVKDGYSPQEFYIAGAEHGPAGDLYALAATFYHLITGVAPPNSQLRMAALAENKPDPLPSLAGCYNDYDPDFLLAIERALSVAPADRPQSAHEWMMDLDAGRRRTAAMARAKSDQSMERAISDLVRETNVVVTQTKAQPTAAVQQAPQEPAKPEPKKYFDWQFEEDDEWTVRDGFTPAPEAPPPSQPVTERRASAPLPEPGQPAQPGLMAKMLRVVGVKIEADEPPRN